jgi:nicotinamidase-related amidase
MPRQVAALNVRSTRASIRSQMRDSVRESKAEAALLLIDVINDFDFGQGQQLLESAVPAAKNIRELKARAKKAGLPAIYVNDNFGQWRSDFGATVEHCRSSLGREVVELLLPEDDDYFVLKPKHSGFYSTPLAELLQYLGAHTLILTGFAGNICVLFTAHDAHMRDFKMFVPNDCLASNTEEENRWALAQMSDVLGANSCPGKEIDLYSWPGK